MTRLLPLATALLAAGAATNPAPAVAQVHLRAGSIGRSEGVAAAALSASPAVPGLWIAVARGKADASFQRRLDASGLVRLGYLPDHAFAVWGTPQALARALGEPEVAWAAPLPAALRVSPELRSLAPERDARVELLLVPGVGIEPVAEMLASLGLAVLGRGPGPRFDRVVATLPAGRDAALLDRIAAIPGVFSLSRRPIFRLLNDRSVWVGQAGTGAVGQTPLFDAGIRGEGQVVAVLDTGLDVDMCWFRDPAGPPPTNTNFGTAFDPTRRKVIAYDFLWSADDPTDSLDWDDHGHGTHVAGSVAGDDLANPIARDRADGMAPAAKLVVQDAGYAVDDCGDIPALGCPMVDLTPYFDQAWQQGARIHTNSWGDQENASPQNNYTAACLDADDFMWTHPEFLLLFAAGNSGPNNDTVGSPSVAKNVISVGATQPGTGADSIAGFSSRGWAADGRIKPTLTCPGQGIVSALTDGDITTQNCGTASFSGTSMASPTCAGLGALARQYFTDGYYPSGRLHPADAFTPSAALVKATLVNSARNMTGTTAIISRSQGFGRVTLADTLSLPAGARQLFVADERDFFPTGGGALKSYDVLVASPGQPLKVTLVWTDFPSDSLAARNLVNDLDLVVTGPGGTFLGNVFAGGVSVTGGSPDRINVEEEVLIASPAAGIWTIEVRAETVPQGPQGFALVATGDFPDPAGAVVAGLVGGSDALEPACTDGDGIPDAGETFRETVTVRNPAEVAATGLTVTLATTSPWLAIVGPNPVAIASLAAGASATVDFDVRVLAAPCGSSAVLEATVTSLEEPVPHRSRRTLTLEEDLVLGDATLDFESGLVDSNGDTWSAAGGFATSLARASGGVTSLWAGVPPGPGHCDGSNSRDGANACATLTSPRVRPQAGATFSLATWYQFEASSAGQFWDRGNVHVVDGASHVLLTPTGGRGYDGADNDATSLCHVNRQDGWAGDDNGTSWATSQFDLSPWAGREIQVEVNYNTDNGSICEGLYLDDIRLTSVVRHACDGRTCASTCAASTLAALRALQGVKNAIGGVDWRWQDPGTAASEWHVDSVLAKGDLAGPDPASPRLAPRGRGILECSATGLACTDPDGVSAGPELRFYQVLAACGPTGADEGAF